MVITPVERHICPPSSVIDEFIFEFTHTVRMDWMLPGEWWLSSARLPAPALCVGTDLQSAKQSTKPEELTHALMPCVPLAGLQAWSPRARRSGCRSSWWSSLRATRCVARRRFGAGEMMRQLAGLDDSTIARAVTRKAPCPPARLPARPLPPQLSAERIYWDQATVLVQLGLLDGASLPVSGAEQADKVVAMARRGQ